MSHARPAAPDLIFFEGMGHMEGARKWSYRLDGFRCPKKGEYYLSGSIPQGYKAPNDLTTEYWIIEPVQAYRQAMTWVPVTTEIGT